MQWISLSNVVMSSCYLQNDFDWIEWKSNWFSILFVQSHVNASATSIPHFEFDISEGKLFLHCHDYGFARINRKLREGKCVQCTHTICSHCFNFCAVMRCEIDRMNEQKLHVKCMKWKSKRMWNIFWTFGSKWRKKKKTHTISIEACPVRSLRWISSLSQASNASAHRQKQSSESQWTLSFYVLRNLSKRNGPLNTDTKSGQRKTKTASQR